MTVAVDVRRLGVGSWASRSIFFFHAVLLIVLLPLVLLAQPTASTFDVRSYVVKGDSSLSTNTVDLSSYTGTNVTAAQIVRAAATLQAAYQARGTTNVSVSVAPERSANGIVTLYVFRTPVPQILISGNRYTNALDLAAVPQGPVTRSTTVTTSPNGTPAGKTNAAPHFPVRQYEISGDTLLTTSTLTSLLVKYTGTNITIADILKAASDLQLEYRSRGFPTVKVTLPQQQITNGVVKIQVIEGRLEDIIVSGNRYFSSNNVMRTVPSLHTNTILRGPVFQAELDRANANQDRQIYAEIDPGPEPGTSDLILKVKDRLPLHGKVELDNQNSPGTPDLRVNSSIVYNNLWQYEHSIGFQYSFSPEKYKQGDQWNFYDLPLVANYSAFYRLPLGTPDAVENAVAAAPGNFGYDEASRQFRLPPSSGRPELNFYASRSTIDTGLMTLGEKSLGQNVGGTQAVTVVETDVQQDITINESVGFRFSQPFATAPGLLSLFSGGLDFKAYDFTSSKTNIFTFTTVIHDQNNHPVATNVATVPQQVPGANHSVDYLPLALRYDRTLRDHLGMTTFGLGLSANLSYSGSEADYQSITGSKQSSGYWVSLTPSLTRDFLIHTNWTLSLHSEGQWTSQPLISNEQFGIGGVNSVRGYHEGEIFGDTGWWAGGEFRTPPHLIGAVYANHPLSVRGVLYMEYGEAYLLDPQGRPGRTPLWGTGFGAAANIGATWEARFLFSWPLLSAGTISAYQPRFDFGLSAQF